MSDKTWSKATQSPLPEGGDFGCGKKIKGKTTSFPLHNCSNNEYFLKP